MAENAYVYYPGCSLEGTASEYDASLKLVLKTLGVDLTEPGDWSCCGSTPAHTVDHVLAAALAARNLALVEKMNVQTVTTPCPSCLSALKRAQRSMSRDAAFKDEVNSLLDEPYNCGIDAKSTLQVIYEDIGLERIAGKVTQSLPDMKVAPYYGCILNRPPDIMQFDSPENPIAMDRVMEAAGVSVVDFAFKLECCGAAFGVPKRKMVNELTSKVLAMAVDAGANCIAVACPLCQQNLDLRQGQVNRTMGSSYNLPVLYFTQIMGLAFGHSPKELGLNKLIVSADPVIRRAPPEKKSDDEKAPVAKKKAKEEPHTTEEN